MNKLTEIRETLEKATPGALDIETDSNGTYLWGNKMYRDHMELIATFEKGKINISDEKLIINAKEWLSYLLSLLEEKDKALKQIAELHIRGIEDRVADPHRAIAKAALTSSNNEGDNPND